MGGAAASNQVQDIISRGGNSQQALMGGLAAGAAEALFEKISLGNLLKPKSITGWKSLLKETAKQAGVEGSEEVFTEIANILSDAAIMGENSSVKLAMQRYMDKNHLTKEDAQKQVFLDCIGQVVLAGAGGVLSGGVMGGGKSMIDWAVTGAQRAKAARQGALASEGTDASKIADTGLARAEDGTMAGVPSTAAQADQTAPQAQRQAPVEADSREGLVAFGREAVERFTKDLPPALATTLREMYNETQGPGAYLEDMMRAHKAGSEGITDPRAVFGPQMESAHITLPQAQAAMLAGQNAFNKEDVGYGQVQRAEEAGGSGAVPAVFGTAQADVPRGAGEGGGEGRSPLAGAPARGAHLAQDGRGGITTAQTQAEYLEGQAVAHKSATIETFKGDTGTDVVVASDAAWEAMFGPGSVESQKAKALNGKIYLPQVSTTWSEQTLRSALTHEGSHVMRQTGYKPYMELLGDVGGYVDFESEATNSLMNGLLAHTGVTMEQFMDDPKAQARVYDELCATISGHTAIGEFEGEFDGKATKLSDFFRSEWEFNEFLGRLQQIQETFHHQNKVQDHGGQQAIGGGPASVGAAERGFTTPGTTPTERTSRLAEGVLHSTSSRREAAGGLMSPPT